LRIPIELNGNLILIQARVNGSVTLNFILDTGSEISIISNGRAQSLGLKRAKNPISATGAPEETELSGVSFELPGLQIKNAVTLALPLDSFEPRLGKRIDG